MSKVEVVVLGVLRFKAMHGYELSQFVKNKRFDVWDNVKTPTIYKTLKKMEIKGYLISTTEQSQEKMNLIKIYGLTDSGETYFRKIIVKFFKEIEAPWDFWLGVSLINKSMTKKQFLKILETQKKKILELGSEHRNTCDGIKDSGKAFPYFFEIMGKKFCKLMHIELESLDQLIEETQKSDNDKNFLE